MEVTTVVELCRIFTEASLVFNKKKKKCSGLTKCPHQSIKTNMYNISTHTEKHYAFMKIK